MSEKPTYEELEQRVQELEQHKSELKHTEKAISDTSELLSLAIKHSPIYTFLKEVSHKESKFISASDNYIDITGIPALQMVGKTMDEVFPHEFAKKITRDNIDVINKGNNLIIDEELNGRNYTTYKFPIRLGDKKYLAGYAIDITERIQAQDALKHSNNLLRAIIEAVPVAIVGLDLDGHVHSVWNPAAEKMLGWSAQEAMGRPLPSVPADRREEFRVFREQIQKGMILDGVEVRRQRRDGTPIDYSVYASPLYDAEGRISGHISVLVDITERKRSEAALKASETRYVDLYENAPDMYVSVNAKTALIENCNITLANTLGYSKEQIVWRPVFEIYHPDCLNQAKEVFEEFLERGEIHDKELQLRRKDGSKLDVSLNVSAVRAEDGTILFARSILRDITARKQAEEALKAEKFKLGGYFENLPMLAYNVTFDGIIANCNKTAIRTLGYNSKDELIGKPLIPIVYAPSSQEKAKRLFEIWKDEKKIKNEEVQVITKQGHVIDVLLNIDTIFDHNGKPIHNLSTHLDITERKKAEVRLSKLNETLERQVAERTKLAEDRAKKLHKLVGELTLAEQRERQRLANFLHDEVQQLLVGAKINCEFLSVNIGEKSKQTADTILKLINQSIQTSRTLTAELSPPVLQMGLSATLEWLGRWMQEHYGLTVELKTDSGIDPQQEEATVFLYQSVRELLLNIVKHAGVKSARLEMRLTKNNQLRVTVSDKGHGFDSASMENDRKGFGLIGISERLELMGGSLQVKSYPGEGASFSLIIPLETKKERGQKGIQKIISKIHKVKTPSEKIRVLLVDDHTVVRQGLSTMLNFYSDIHVVGEAADGEEAVEKARELQPDVILMDISMPKMDGIKATRIIHSKFPNIYIIGLSMHDKQDQADRMIEAGASAYCTKDGDSNKLLSAIRGEGARNRHREIE